MSQEITNPDDPMERLEQLRLLKGLKPLERRPVPHEVAAVWDWPWKPFRNHSAEEGHEISKRRIKNQFQSEGFDLPEDPNREMVAHLLEGHMDAVQHLGGIAKVLVPFLERLPNWDPRQPDWSAVERLLLNTHRVSPENLPGLTVLEIRRYLSIDPIQPNKSQVKRSPSKKIRQQKRIITDIQTKVLSLSLADNSVSQIAEQLGCTQQNVRKHLKAAKKNQGSLREKSNRSAKARSNFEGLDERQSRPRF